MLCELRVLAPALAHLPASRNRALAEALQGGFSHLLFADSDMAWPPAAVARLLSWGVDVVSGCYVSRHGSELSSHRSISTTGTATAVSNAVRPIAAPAKVPVTWPDWKAWVSPMACAATPSATPRARSS